MKKLISIVACALLLGGCASKPQLSRAEWLEMTSKSYQGVTSEQVYQAAEKLFYLADGKDFKFAHYDDAMIASRDWSSYMVVALVEGTDHWKVKAKDENGGVKVSVEVTTDDSVMVGTPDSGGDWGVTTAPMLKGTPIEGTALYKIFWARMDYLLGKSNKWTTCADGKKWLDEKIVWGNIDALCNKFNIKDNAPKK